MDVPGTSIFIRLRSAVSKLVHSSTTGFFDTRCPLHGPPIARPPVALRFSEINCEIPTVSSNYFVTNLVSVVGFAHWGDAQNCHTN